jgi:hypothetical protein
MFLRQEGFSMEHDERNTDDLEQQPVEAKETEAVEDEQIADAEPVKVDFPATEMLAYQEAGDNDSSEEPTGEEADIVALTDVELNELIESICTSKAEEFRMIGYEHVTGREIWECVSDRYQKTGMPALHKIVNDILSLKVTQFMNWMTMSIYKSNPFA